jgi:hypothetical protein
LVQVFEEIFLVETKKVDNLILWQLIFNYDFLTAVLFQLGFDDEANDDFLYWLTTKVFIYFFD